MRHRKISSAEAEMTPLLDIVFILLIFRRHGDISERAGDGYDTAASFGPFSDHLARNSGQYFA